MREAIAEDKKKEPYVNYRSHWYDGFSFEEEVSYTNSFALECLGGILLELEEDTLEDEACLLICRETSRVRDAVQRLLKMGCIEEAVSVAKQASDYTLLSIADLFVEAGQDVVAERIIQQRAWKSRDSRLLE